MSDLARKLEEARAHVRGEWSDERAEKVLASLEPARRRRAKVRAAMIAAPVLLAACAALGLAKPWSTTKRETPALAAKAHEADAPRRLADGSTIALRGAASKARVTSESPELVSATVDEGSATFDVTHREDRAFVVTCGEVTVTVLGTSFEVERLGSGARVSVSSGAVRVAWGSGSSIGSEDLHAGESGTFPRASAANAPPAIATMPLPESHPSAAASHAAPAPSANWRSLAQDGEYAKAEEVLEASPVGEDVADLLLAADVARLSGHAARAVPYLRRVVSGHAGDPRAALAAFTLGRVLLDQLGQPREAAEAFASSRRLGGAMQEDALAREVEAWSRAGDAARAHDRAEEYVTKFPSGRRLKSVRRLGAIE